MHLLQLSCDLQTLNLTLIYCHTNLNFVHINILCLSQVIFQDFLLKDQFPVPVYMKGKPAVTSLWQSSIGTCGDHESRGQQCRSRPAENRLKHLSYKPWVGHAPLPCESA